MVDLRESARDRELALLLDVSRAAGSAQACQIAEEFTARLGEHPVGMLVDLSAGDLLLTKGVLSKIKQMVQRAGAVLGTVYSSVPQTQMAALDEGLYVKERMSTDWTPIRQPLPTPKTPAATKPISPAVTEKSLERSADKSRKWNTGVDLPDFSRPSGSREVSEFTPVAPQSLEIPELATPAVEEAAPVEVEGVALETTLEISEDAAEQTLEAMEIETPEGAFETLYMRQTLRSGQTVRFNGNVVIVGDVHAGSEITAGGDILVWGELRGIAHAGAQGNFKSEIRAMKIEALQLRIADYIARRPDRIYYHKDGAEGVLSPEVARVADGEIKIFKTMLTRG